MRQGALPTRRLRTTTSCPPCWRARASTVPTCPDPPGITIFIIAGGGDWSVNRKPGALLDPLALVRLELASGTNRDVDDLRPITTRGGLGEHRHPAEGGDRHHVRRAED